VLSFQWTNPHGYIDLAVAEGPPGIDRYTVELTSINMLRRGKEFTRAIGHRDRCALLNGQQGGLLLELKMPDGRTLVPPVPAIDSFKRSK
jgi:hypothetical protein